MEQLRLGELLPNSIQRPVRICMDDGRACKVFHPEFALAAPEAVGLSSGPGPEFGVSFVTCWFDHISRIEVSEKPRARPKT